MSYQERTGPLMANSHPGSYSGQDAYSDLLITENRGVQRMGDWKRSDASDPSTEESRSIEHDARPDNSPHYRARRLTPIECAKLQGFPTDWCADVPHSDSAEYKLWGNGISLPVLLPMFKAMRKVMEEDG